MEFTRHKTSTRFSIFQAEIFIYNIPETELALWGSGALKAGEGLPAARASAPLSKMILEDVL